MLSQVIKVVEPSAVFKPIKWSDLQKIKTPDAGLILKLLRNGQNRQNKKKSENVPKIGA